MDTKRYQTGIKRFWAAIIDWAVFLPLIFVERWIYKTTSNIPILFSWMTFVLFAPIIYSIFLHYKFGQTYGKWVVGVKVLDIRETSTLTFRQSLYRDGFYFLIALIGLFYYGILLTRISDQGTLLTDYSGFSDTPIFWWTIIELITMLTNSKRRALHDFIAKSIVVRSETKS